MNLIELARRLDPGRTIERDVTNEELELFIAYMEGVVTAKQCKDVLERSSGYFYNWCRRCLFALYMRQKLTIDNNDRKVIFRPKTYEQKLAARKEMLKHVVR